MGPSELVVGDRLATDPVELVEERPFDAIDRDAGPDGRPAGPDRGAGDEAQAEPDDVLGDPLVANEPTMEPAALPAGQDLGRDVEGVEPFVAERRRAEPEEDPGQRDAILDDLPTLATDRRRQALSPSAGIDGLAGIAPK